MAQKMDITKPQPIENAEQLETALDFITELMEKNEHVDDGLVKHWAVLVQSYENEHYPMPPIDLLTFYRSRAATFEHAGERHRDSAEAFNAAAEDLRKAVSRTTGVELSDAQITAVFNLLHTHDKPMSVDAVKRAHKGAAP